MMSGSIEPYDPQDAKTRIRSILEAGVVTPSRHALVETEQDGVVVAFRSESKLAIVTAWRERQ